MLAFGDFETAGIDPDKDLPLEFGLVVTTDDLEVLSEHRWIFLYPLAVVAALRSACTFEAHEKTGLWDELSIAGACSAVAGARVVALADFDEALCKIADFGDEKPELAGFGPHFDQRFLRRYAPDFLDRLSYRLRDVRTLAQEVQLRYPTDWGPKPGGSHRALDDCHAAISYLRWFRSHVMTPYGKAKR